MKAIVAAWLAVFLAWSVLDGLVHGLLFRNLYAALPGVWRPMAEIKVAVVYAGVLTTAAAFVGIYALLVQPRTRLAGLVYGLLYGLAMGASLASGGYAVHPIQIELALGWFLLALVEGVAAGAIVGTLIRSRPAR